MSEPLATLAWGIAALVPWFVLLVLHRRPRETTHGNMSDFVAVTSVVAVLVAVAMVIDDANATIPALVMVTCTILGQTVAVVLARLGDAGSGPG